MLISCTLVQFILRILGKKCQPFGKTKITALSTDMVNPLEMIQQ